jgi:phage portal protein BeeE
MNGFARASMSTRGEFYQKMLRNGVFSPNEIRKLEDMAPYAGGDKYYISRDLIDVDLLEDYTLNDLNNKEG